MAYDTLRARTSGLGRPVAALLASRVRVAALLVLIAEVGHLVMILYEWPQWVLRGIFHTAAAAALGVLAVSLVFGPSPRALRRGAALASLLAVLWLVSRTLGIPSYLTLQTLPVGIVDTLTATIELATAVLLMAELRRRRRRPPA